MGGEFFILGGIIFHLKPLKTGIYFISWFSFQSWFLVDLHPLILLLFNPYPRTRIIYAPLRIASFSLRSAPYTIQGRRMARTFSMSMTLSVAPLQFLRFISKTPVAPPQGALPVRAAPGGGGAPSRGQPEGWASPPAPPGGCASFFLKEKP